MYINITLKTHLHRANTCIKRIYLYQIVPTADRGLKDTQNFIYGINMTLKINSTIQNMSGDIQTYLL
jgi:hypothetical protein